MAEQATDQYGQRLAYLQQRAREAVDTLQGALDDCPCCGDAGYVKDGICVSCGWGDIDHARGAQFRLAAEPVLRELLPHLGALPEHVQRQLLAALALLDGAQEG